MYPAKDISHTDKCPVGGKHDFARAVVMHRYIGNYPYPVMMLACHKCGTVDDCQK